MLGAFLIKPPPPRTCEYVGANDPLMPGMLSLALILIATRPRECHGLWAEGSHDLQPLTM